MMIFLLTSNSFLSILAGKRRENLDKSASSTVNSEPFLCSTESFFGREFCQIQNPEKGNRQSSYLSLFSPSRLLASANGKILSVRRKIKSKMKNSIPDAKDATKINKNMVLSCCKGTLNFLNEATCSLSILRDSLDQIMEESEKEQDLFHLEAKINVFANALKFFYNGFSEPYSDLASWIDAFEEGEGA